MKRTLLDDSQKKLLRIIRDNSYLSKSTEEVMEYMDVAYPQAINNKLKQLENKGYIRRNDFGEYYALRESVEDVYYFPLIGFAQCGNLGTSDITDINFSDTMAFSTKELSINDSDDLKNYFFTRAKGDSMLPLIKENDLVLIKIQQYSTPADNTLLIHNDKPKIKRVFKNGEGIYTLLSLNPQFPELELSESDDQVKIIGVVKKIVSSL